jgi:hypothetical protein
MTDPPSYRVLILLSHRTQGQKAPAAPGNTTGLSNPSAETLDTPKAKSSMATLTKGSAIQRFRHPENASNAGWRLVSSHRTKNVDRPEVPVEYGQLFALRLELHQ